MKLYRPNELEIAGQAAEWLHSIRTGEARERAGFADWLLESRRNVRAALLTIAVEKELEQFDPQERFDVEAMLADTPHNVVALEEAHSLQPLRDRLTLARLLPRWRWSLAAPLACLAVTWLLWHWLTPTGSVFATATGQQQSVKLDDGSVVHLNTESRIRVEFSGRERGVRLLVGEALFDVQREAARPFQVHVGTTLVRALGTQFNVDQHASVVTVSVLDGRVEILNDAGNHRILKAGEEARIGTHGEIEDHEMPNIKRRVAWRERRLEFQEDPLSTVAAEFNRYNRTPRLRIEGARIGTRTYTGILSADDPDSLVQILAEEPDLVLERKGGEIVIRAR